MFIASYKNTMAGAKAKLAPKPETVVRTIEEIRREKRASRVEPMTPDLIEIRRKQANDLIRKGREAAARVRLSEMALDAYRIINVSAPITIRGIVSEVADKYGVTVDELVGRNRSRRLIQPRHEAMWLLRQRRPDMAIAEIGRVFERDHTTVLHALAKIEAQRMAA